MIIKRIKILIAIPNLYGGTGVFCKNLANEKGVLNKDKKFFDEIYIINSDVHQDIRRFWEIFYHFYFFKKYIKKIKPDIIFSIGTYANTLSFFSGINKNKIIFSEHDTPSIRIKYSKYKKLIKFFMKVMYKKTKIISISKGVMLDLIKNLGAKKTKLIYHGVDEEEIYRLSQEKIIESINFPYIIFVGRLTIPKDPVTLINGYYEAVKKGIKENLIIVGEGEKEEEIKDIIKNLNLNERVFLLGYKPNPYPYIKKAKVFILPSIWEGLGYVLLESLSLGVPIISTNFPSALEILENGKFGILVPIKDYKKLGEAIYELLKDENKLQELKEKSIIRSKFFLFEKMIKSYDELFMPIYEKKL